MATLTPIQITRAGILVTLAAAAAGGDVFDNSLANTHIEVLNGAGVSQTVFAATYFDGISIVQGRSWVLAAGERRKIGPFTANYVDPATGRVSLTYSAVVTLTIGVFYI